ncbi:MAG: ABC transporter permease [Clostridia bacterium]|nr:ABC transporter permease [Clostridia bacterium]
MDIKIQDLPSNLRPLSAWAYFGYTLLFSIPVVGFILLIIFSFNRSNINRRSFARSYFCSYIIVAILFVILILTGVGAEVLGMLN